MSGVEVLVIAAVTLFLIGAGVAALNLESEEERRLAELYGETQAQIEAEENKLQKKSKGDRSCHDSPSSPE